MLDNTISVAYYSHKIIVCVNTDVVSKYNLITAI